MSTKTKNIGLNVKAPTTECDDANCPFHGSLSVRGQSFVGTVMSHKMQRSAVVSWENRKLIPKYERFKKSRSQLSVHNPPCIDAREGDKVRIVGCRPLSKTKHFVIVEKLGAEEAYLLEKELDAEGKHKVTKKEAANVKKKEVADKSEAPTEKLE